MSLTYRSLAVACAAAVVLTTTASAANPQPHRDGELDAVNLPPDDKVLFLIGQDSQTLAEFESEVLDADPAFPQPGGVSLYTNIVGTPLAGLYQTVDFGAGPTNFPQTLSEYPGAVSVGLYLVDCSLTPLQAIAGSPDVPPDVVRRYQDWTDELITWLRDTRRDVFLKVGYEFDGEWNCYQPAEYRAAFRHIAQRIDDLRARNIATVWQSATWPGEVPEPYLATTPGHWDRWYPGDDAVDWVGMSTFYSGSYREHQWSCAPAADIAADPRTIQDDLLNFARARGKPVMIAEAAPQGHDLGELTAGCIFESGKPWAKLEPISAGELWHTWFTEFFGYAHANRDIIRAVSYINTDWDSQSMWQCTAERCPNGYWGDSRLQANPEILARVKAELHDSMWAAPPSGSDPTDDTSPRRGVLEAEYEPVPTGWSGDLGYGGLALPEPTASNDRLVLLANYQRFEPPSVRFPNIGRASSITVRYAARDVVDDRGTLTYQLLINGQPAGTRRLADTGGPGDYATDQWNVQVRSGDLVEIRLNGNIMWLDMITAR